MKKDPGCSRRKEKVERDGKGKEGRRQESGQASGWTQSPTGQWQGRLEKAAKGVLSDQP